MRGMRDAIETGTFDAFVSDFQVRWNLGDIDPL
jgi:hypothetical protein